MRAFHFYGKSIIVILGWLMLFCGTAQAISISPYRNVVTVHSLNHQYRATSVPHSSINESRWGKTDVYDNRTSDLLYTIPECLTEGYLFISDDGRTVAHIIDNAYRSQDTSSYITHEINLYRNGEVLRRLTLDELLQCDRCEDFLLFNARQEEYIGGGEYISTFAHRTSTIEKFVSDHPIFLYHDTVFIYTSTYKLIKLDLLTGQFTEAEFNTFTLEQLSAMPTIERIEEEFKNPYNQARLKEPGVYDDIDEALAKVFHMKNDLYKAGSDKYKYYRVYAWLRISRDGKAIIVLLENKDSLPDVKLCDAITALDYSFPSTLPDEINIWYQEFYAFLRKSNNIVAAKERRLERQRQQEEVKKRLKADTIDGFYIPRNIEECFHQLDTLLSPTDIKTIRNYSSREETIKLHLGLGRWLRNNWGLWGGSRLLLYLFDRGLKHPDDMSAAILEFYWDYLHDIDERWKAFDAIKTDNDH